jgi:hypothetical protein
MNNLLDQKEEDARRAKAAAGGSNLSTNQLIGGVLVALPVAWYFMGLKALFFMIPAFIVIALLDAEKQMSAAEKKKD